MKKLINSHAKEKGRQQNSNDISYYFYGFSLGEQAKMMTLKVFLKIIDLRMPMFIMCMLQVIQQFSGINAVCKNIAKLYFFVRMCFIARNNGILQSFLIF